MKDLLSFLNSDSLALLRTVGLMAQERKEVAYLVGGPVRDLMLKRSTVDLDIVVEGHGLRLAEAFAAKHPGARVTSYPAFKTATIYLSSGFLIDFAMARKETYSRGGAFPAVMAASIKEDLFRRDFTVNAMALKINPHGWGKLLDPFGGADDLRQHRIRILHDKSFIDDPTRILRAARFKARFGFSIERETLKVLKWAIKIKVLDTIKLQRYLKEFKKITQEPQAKAAIKCLKSWNAYRWVAE